MNFEINYRAELISQEYREYFRFQRNKVLFGKWYLLLVLLSLLLSGYGFFEKNNALIISGIGALFIMFYVFLRVFTGARFMYRQFLKNIEKSPLITEGSYRVLINENGIVYQSQKIKNEIPWNKIHSFEENNHSVYLHLEGNRLLDIFSEKLNGEILYREILTELAKRVKKK